MSKKFLYIASILLTIIVGTVLFWYYCCDCGGKNSHIETAADISIVPDEEIAEPIAPVPGSAETIDWLAIRDQLNSNPLTLNFETYQTESNFGQEDLTKVNEIVDYLKNNPDGSLLVTGHADITGPHTLNMKLGQERANFVKSYLLREGVDEDKVISSSKGPDEPAADNRTPEGRAKNRRAVVFIN